jgi:YVTN family beta-propeller protein
MFFGQVSVVKDSTNKVVANITVGDLGAYPLGVAYDSAKGEIFVSNEGGQNVSVIDDSTDMVVDSIPVGLDPWGIAYDSDTGEIFVANQGSHNVSVISDSTNRVVANTRVGTEPFGLAYDSGLDQIMVANYGSNNVTVLSGVTNRVVANLTVGQFPAFLDYDTASGNVYAANYGQGTVSIISDGAVYPVIISVKLSPTSTTVSITGLQKFTPTPECTGGACPAGTTYAWSLTNNSLGSLDSATGAPVTFTAGYITGTLKLYVNATLNGVTEGASATITIVPLPGSNSPYVAYTLDLCNNSLLPGNSLPLNCMGAKPYGAAYDSARGETFVADLGSMKVSVINDTTDLVTGSISVGQYPYGVAYDSGKREIFVTNSACGPDGCSGSTVSVISDVSDTVVATITMQSISWGLAYDSARGEVFVANGMSHNVSVINDTTNRVVDLIPVRTNPHGVAYDSGKGEIFVSNDEFEEDPSNVSVIDDSTNGVVANITVGTDPLGVTYDSGKGEVFVANAGSDNVSVINDTTGRVSSTIRLASAPEYMAYDSGRGEIFITNGYANNVTIVSDSTDSVVASTGLGHYTFGLTYDSRKGEVLVTNVFSANVSVVDDSTNSVVATVILGASPMNMAYDGGKGEMFVADEGSASVSVINGTTNRAVALAAVGDLPESVAYDGNSGNVFATVSYAGETGINVISDSSNSVVATALAGVNPQGVAYDSGKGEVFVANYGSASLSVINSSTYAAAGLVNTHPYDPVSLVYDSGKGVLYVTLSNMFGGSALGVVNDSTNSVTELISVGNAPEELAYDSARGEIFVTNSASDNVSVINDTTDTVVATIGLTGGPYGIACDSANGEIFVSYGNSNSVTVISDATDRVVANVTVGAFPSGLAFDPSNRDMYVSNWGQGTISVIAQPIAIASFTASLDPTEVGVRTTLNVSASGGTSPDIYSYTGLPEGCLSSDTASLTCTPTVSGTFTVRVFVNDSVGIRWATDTLSLTVTSGLSILSFAAARGSIYVNAADWFNVSFSGGTAPYLYAYTGLPPGCVSSSTDSLACTPTGAGTFTVRVYVNDSLGNSASSTATLAVGTPVTLTSVTVDPTTASLAPGETENFTATPVCSNGDCPAGTTYLWSLNSSLGSLSAKSGSFSVFTAGYSPGMVALTVNATLAGITRSATATITIVYEPPVLSSVSIYPASVAVTTGDTTPLLTVDLACSGGACPAGAVYAWSLSNDLGQLNSTSAPAVVFTAGSATGSVTAFVNVTLNGKTVQGSPAVITIGASSPSPQTGFLGLPGDLGYALIGVVVIVVVVAAVVLFRMRRKPAAAEPADADGKEAKEGSGTEKPSPKDPPGPSGN